MSLINDALKRGSKKPAPRPDLPPGVPVMSAAEPERRRAPWALFAAIFSVALIFVFFRSKSNPASSAAPTNSVQASAPVNQPAAAAARNPVQSAAAVLNKVAERNDEGAAAPPVAASTAVARPVAATPAAVETVTPAPPALKPAEIKLQAIYFRLNNPTALLNGKTLRPGQNVEGVEGAKLVAINRTSVEVEVDGVRRTLNLK